jgi:hypothetical protein
MGPSHYMTAMRHPALDELSRGRADTVGVMDRLEKERTRQGLSLQRLGALSGVDACASPMRSALISMTC